MSSEILIIIATTLVAAIVNGALGYGFSSISVPVLLLFYANRILNPAMVLIEVPLNAYMLWINRRSVPAVFRRVVPILATLVPGIIAGTVMVSRLHPEWMKFYTYAALLPLILLQAAGVRRPIRNESRAGLALGAGVGVLYATTTVSGPPLALMLNNQGVAKEHFRAALGLVRLVESSLTLLAYTAAGLLSWQSTGLLRFIVPSVCIGIPLGARVIQHLRVETFRRVCMSFDAWVVGFGISTVLRKLHLVDGLAAYGVLAAVAVVDTVLLVIFFSRQRRTDRYADDLAAWPADKYSVAGELGAARYSRQRAK